jgi:hypothetical protein
MFFVIDPILVKGLEQVQDPRTMLDEQGEASKIPEDRE